MERPKPDTHDRSPSQAIRLFIALAPPKALRSKVAQLLDTADSDLPKARWVPRSNLHLTLLFLGNLDPARAEEIPGLIEPAVSRFPAPRLRFGHLGSFPRGRPRVLWLGVESRPPLDPLVKELASACSIPNQRFKPHLTLARVKTRWSAKAMNNLEARLQDAFGLSWTADAAVVMESTLTPKGARYSAQAVVPFAPHQVAS